MAGKKAAKIGSREGTQQKQEKITRLYYYPKKNSMKLNSRFLPENEVPTFLSKIEQN